MLLWRPLHIRWPASHAIHHLRNNNPTYVQSHVVDEGVGDCRFSLLHHRCTSVCQAPGFLIQPMFFSRLPFPVNRGHKFEWARWLVWDKKNNQGSWFNFYKGE